MPVASFKPSAPAVPTAPLPRVESPQAHTPIVDTRYVPRKSLMTFVEGSVYTVDWFSQVVGRDSVVTGQDPTQKGAYQQYRRIKKLDLKMDSPLSSQQDAETKAQTVRGTAYIHGSVIPNTGDMFTADVGDGRLGVFEVMSQEQGSIFKDAVYHVEFMLMYFADEEQTRYQDLISKIVLDLNYVKDFARAGQDPLIADNELESMNELQYLYKQIIDNYFRWFYSREFGTFILPGQQWPVYDPYVMKFMMALMTTRDHPLIVRTRLFNIGDSNEIAQPQLYEALLQRDPELLKFGNQKMGLVNVVQFNNDPMVENIRYSGVKNIVHPVPNNDNIDSQFNKLKKVVGPDVLRNAPTLNGNLNDLIITDLIKLADDTEIKPIHLVLADEYYVLSASFYEGIKGQSLLENLCKKFINNEGYSAVDVYKLANSYSRWGGLERFYYMPLLLLLIKGFIMEL